MSYNGSPIDIQTFVFFDMETTGLPEYEAFKTKITELAFVACTKDHLLATPINSTPRALYKLVLPFNPYKMISPESTKLSDLDNYLLENVPPFTKNTVDLLTTFFKQLPQPACLVAHNGNKFDYPILQKSIKTHVDQQLDGSELLCLDSLEAFRSIEQFRHKKQTTTAESSDDLDQFLEIINIDLSQSECTEFKDAREILSAVDPRKVQAINERTPSKFTQPFNGRKRKGKNFTAVRNKIHAPRSLFDIRSSMKLVDVYERLHNEYPEVLHHAEADAMILLQCAVAVREEFVKYAELNAHSFNDVRPL